MADNRTATAFAPASIGNLAVGFDMLGLAIAGVGDRVTATRTPGAGVVIAEVRDPAGGVHTDLSDSSGENTASVAAQALWSAHGSGGLSLIIEKGIPLKSGMGSSAASAVAGAVAANAVLDAPLAPDALLEFALEGEKLASGSMHADNVAPSLLGGLVLCPPALHPRLIPLPVPEGMVSVLLHPDLTVSTAESRRSLPATVSRDQWLAQQGYLAAFVAALSSGDIDLVGASLRDVIIEPQRAGSVPCFSAVASAARDAGALGVSLSGSGPSIFAIAREATAEAVEHSMVTACRSAGYTCEAWISPLDAPGAFVEAVE